MSGPPWARRKRRHSDWPPGAAIVATIFHLAGTRQLAERGGAHLALTPAAVALLLIGPLALLWRRRFPVPVFVVSATASLVVAIYSSPHWMYAVAPGMALFHLARLGRRTTAAIAAAVTWTVWASTTVLLAGPLGLDPSISPGPRELMLGAAAMAGTVLLGTVSKARGEHLAALTRAREEQRRAQAEQKRRQESEERLRMAQELHDVLGHHLSLINVQAGVGLHLMDNRPEQAREALTAIKTASAEALREVRSVLAVLRTEGEPAPREPSPGLDRLPALTTDAGFPVTTHIEGDPRPLPPEVDRAAYRIAQEALTNVRRHAAPSPSVRVELTYAPATLTLRITDTPLPGSPARAAGRSPGSGNGITGMRARAESLGGHVAAGPLPSGGFQVTATLPAPRTGTGDPDGGGADGGGAEGKVRSGMAEER
ncbi:sensor histidine kinase [Actinoplanes couchii]|uniref:histidine kinase n=1 Tax=Actinoplanes couchii TaxID=403638 RepID=A0ABQ3X292_9ACTN|nr:two-component sensor histidine kinase [Actinoplanes couchii]